MGEKNCRINNMIWHSNQRKLFSSLKTIREKIAKFIFHCTNTIKIISTSFIVGWYMNRRTRRKTCF